MASFPQASPQSPAFTVPSLSHLTSCTPFKSNLYLANSLAAAISDPALYRLLFRCGNILLLTTRFLDVAKFTIITPLSLLSWCRLSFSTSLKQLAYPPASCAELERVSLRVQWPPACSTAPGLVKVTEHDCTTVIHSIRFEAVMEVVMELNVSIFKDVNCFIGVWEMRTKFWRGNLLENRNLEDLQGMKE